MNKVGKVILIRDLKNTNENAIESDLYDYVKNNLGLPVSLEQRKSWIDCIKYLKDTFINISEYDDMNIAFEYFIPLSCYRRPDVIMFYKKKILVLEFKKKNLLLEIDKSQLRWYLNEIRNFHYISHQKSLNIIGVLVATEGENYRYKDKGIEIIEGNLLLEYLNEIDKNSVEPMTIEDVNTWIESDYKPLLSIIEATSKMFLKGEVSHIKNIEEGNIQKTQDFLFDEIKSNKNKKKIFFLMGVPGAGKTLVLLNILYYLNILSKGEFLKAIFTSGNGPLISTLRYILSEDKSILDGAAFIKDIKNIKSSLYNKYSDYATNDVKSYETILFDESQRSWDLKHMQQYNYNVSEPELLLRIQNKAFYDYGRSNLVCSYGEGQSIYLGEESGFEIWSEILNRKEYEDWEVYCPNALAPYFDGRKRTAIIDELFIDTSIRGTFIDVNPFINYVLNNDLIKAREEFNKISTSAFSINISRDFNEIKDYLRQYEVECNDSFYGLVTSSNASLNTIKKTITGFKNVLSQKDNPRIGKWYVEDCSKLEEAAAEFGCQGLELNIPVVIFGRDYIIRDGKWQVSEKVLYKAKIDRTYEKVLKYNNRNEIFKSIYRVLLSRGRKGLILFLPDGCKDLDDTYDFFREIGIKNINEK